MLEEFMLVFTLICENFSDLEGLMEWSHCSRKEAKDYW